MRTVAAAGMKERLYEILDEIATHREPVAIESEGDTLVVVLDPRDYERMARIYALGRIQKDRAWETVERIRERNADKDPDEIYRVVPEVVEEVRATAR